MMKLNKNDILAIYSKIKNFAKKAYSKKRYNQCIDYIKMAAHIASLFNWIYTDEELENLLYKLSCDIIPVSDPIEIISNRYVFYDFRACDNCCLTQQYLRALISYKAEILYIPEKLIPSQAKSIINELSLYPKARIFEVGDSMTSVERIRATYKEIAAFKPEKIFLQLAPSSAMAIALFNAFPGIPKYFIDLADHVFYLGRSCADFFIEFRNRGCSVALEKRYLLQKQLLVLPYYPVIEKSDFSGFPVQVNSDKVVIFSGGHFYKVNGKDGIYFDILKRIVSENPSVIILYAGMGIDTMFREFIKENKFDERIILLGFRNDIAEVFKHCDIYLNTYPYSGGLMCQYAAINGKPILAFNTENRESDFVETIVCDNTDIKITHTNLPDLYSEANRLINDKEYRKFKGDKLQKSILSPTQFNSLLYKLINTNSVSKTFNTTNIDYDGFFNRYLDMQNTNSYAFKSFILKKIGLKSIILFPKVIWLTLPLLLKPQTILNKIRQK